MCAILFVEDHEDTRVVFAKVLRSWGHEVTAVGCMASALEELQENRFDVIVSDLGLPDASGWELMRAVRQKKPHVLGIAITGDPGFADHKRSREAGFDLHLAKPVDLARLHAVLRDAPLHTNWPNGVGDIPV